MNIFIDTGHPVHIHFYYPIAKKLENDGHSVLFTIREKECSLKIAQSYNLNYISKGKGSYSIYLKPFYLIRSICRLYSAAKTFNPDIFLSFASPYVGFISCLMHKPHIVFDDTEPDPLVQRIYRIFSSTIITPSCFQKDFGKNHIKINSYKELSYLRTDYFEKNSRFKERLGFSEEEEYILIRLVNHGALHDMFSKKWNLKNKFDFIKSLSLNYNIVISSEIELPDELKKHQYKLSVTDFHQAIANAKIVIGESATVATESAVLGVLSIYIDYNTRGYINEIEEAYGLITHIKPTVNELKKVERLIYNIMQNEPSLLYLNKRQNILSEKIDVTAFMVWFIENYPESVRIMKENPDYQYNFK